MTDLGTGPMIGDDKTIRNMLGQHDRMGDNLVSSILRKIKQMPVPNNIQERANQIWRKIVKSSFCTHISNYLRHESSDIEKDDDKYMRQQKMLRSVLVGDLGASIVTDK